MVNLSRNITTAVECVYISLNEEYLSVSSIYNER